MTVKQVYALCKSYTDISVEGAGAIKGKNCEIQSIEPITGGNRVTFAWYNGSDVLVTDTLDVMDGEDGQDGAKGDKGDKGDTGATGATGNGIASIEKTSTVGNVDTYTITMTDGTTATFTVTNGGVNVVANPEGVASESLSKIMIGDDIYSVSSGGQGTSDYTELENKPQINSVTLAGNKSSADLGLVSAETGKGLSTNDYTNTDKAIVDGVTSALALKADKTEIPDSLDDLSDDASHRTVTDTEKTTWNGKADVSAIPTKTTDLTNDSGFITNTVNNLVNYYTKSQTYSQSEVDTLITAAKNGRFIAVATLPTTDIDTKAIYLVPSSDPEAGNVKDEYINLDGTSAGWELIGSTAIDLSGYVQKSSTAGLIKNDGTIDTTQYQNRNLDTPVVVKGIYKTTVEPALHAINDSLDEKGGVVSFSNEFVAAIDPDTGAQSVSANIGSVASGNTGLMNGGVVYTALGGKLDVTRVAPEFHDDVAYTTGQYVTRNGFIYRFKTNHSAGAFNPQEVFGVTIGDVLADKEYITSYDSGDFLVITGEDSTTGYTTNTVSLNKATAPTQSDTKPITSGGVYTAIEKKPNTFTGTTAEWNALTSAQKSAYTIVNLTDDFVYSRLSDIYSTDERVVGVWIDGKPLYQKTVVTTTPSTSEVDTVVVQTSTWNIDTPISIKAFTLGNWNNVNYNQEIPYTEGANPQSYVYLSSGGSEQTFIQFNNSNDLYCKCGNARTNVPLYITLQYTKTTDA